MPTLRSILAVTAVALTAAGAGASAASPSQAPSRAPSAAVVPFALVQDRDVADRLPQPEDRYAVAGGCYVVEAPGQGFVSRRGAALTVSATEAQALPLHFQATRLGEYLLATDEGPETRYAGATWDVRKYLAAPVTGAAVVDSPSTDTEWRLVANGANPDAKARRNRTQTYRLSVPSRNAALTVSDGTVTAGPGAGTALVLRHVKRADCARWPEIDTAASGKPAPVPGNPTGPVKGFMDAHVHGLAYEFLGGKLRCGSPWHPYGVEFALGDCRKKGNVLNSALEVGLAGQEPTDPVQEYDPVGWPTFGYWPKHDTLTHEQYYYRWLERAYLGGLRMTTNLLVDNTALCQAFPVKKNSCNEMDSVRLQARRMHELQDYIDAQSGGPGEGWYRIVTTPAQARQSINAGRLAVVMGIEVSTLFDCGEILDVPQCTTADIDKRLQEVYDLGIRQMELLNKFDSALAGVTGDGGSTGVVVNSGNQRVTGHFWDMKTCPATKPGHAHEHDKTQINAGDDLPDGGRGEADVLAGAILRQFGPAKGVVPAYPKGPHCNSRGLTALGTHLIKAMIGKGMIFDPDHMSAQAQREALDLVRDLAAPAAAPASKGKRQPALEPAVLSSHGWGNDEIYQRIFRADGIVTPYAGDAGSYVREWTKLRGYAAKNAPAGYDFGMGYGADTNGLGGQPGPRNAPAKRLDYSKRIASPVGGVTLGQQRSGLKSYDINTDGVAQYGMFADWYAEVALEADEKQPGLGGGRAIIADMLNASEVYLKMWERGTYGGGGSCVKDGSNLQAEDLQALIGGNLEGFLESAGAPLSRDGAAYVYCAQDRDGQLTAVRVAFDDEGRATTVTTAPKATLGALTGASTAVQSAVAVSPG